MKHQILSLFAVLSVGPVSLGVPDPKPVMIFDVRRVPEIPEMLVSEGIEQGVPSHLAILVPYRESRFNPLALNKKSNCKGLFQLAPLTVKVLHVADPFDTRQNMIAGLGLLGNYFRFGGERYAMCAFAKGPQHCKIQTGARR